MGSTSSSSKGLGPMHSRCMVFVAASISLENHGSLSAAKAGAKGCSSLLSGRLHYAGVLMVSSLLSSIAPLSCILGRGRSSSACLGYVGVGNSLALRSGAGALPVGGQRYPGTLNKSRLQMWMVNVSHHQTWMVNVSHRHRWPSGSVIVR